MEISSAFSWDCGSSGSVCVTINNNWQYQQQKQNIQPNTNHQKWCHRATDQTYTNRQFTRLLPSPRYLICISFPPFSCIWCQFCGQFSVYFSTCILFVYIMRCIWYGYCYCNCLLLLFVLLSCTCVCVCVVVAVIFKRLSYSRESRYVIRCHRTLAFSINTCKMCILSISTYQTNIRL